MTPSHLVPLIKGSSSSSAPSSSWGTSRGRGRGRGRGRSVRCQVDSRQLLPRQLVFRAADLQEIQDEAGFLPGHGAEGEGWKLLEADQVVDGEEGGVERRQSLRARGLQI